MKKVIFVILFLTIAFFVAKINVIAVSVSPTDSPSPTHQDKEEQQIDDLKSRIASRVAELNLVEKRGIIGTVTDSSGTQITLSDLNDKTRFVDVDELTKFSSPSSKTFGISDVGKDMKLGVLGLYNKQSRRLLAREVNVITLPKIIHGAIFAIDSKNYSIEVAGINNKKTAVDVETVTKTLSYSKDSLIKSGFSKITESQNVIVIGFPDKQDKSRIVASRIIVFPNIPKNPIISVAPTANTSATITPSTASGKNLTPAALE